MPPSFAWPFRKLPEDQKEDQAQAQAPDRDEEQNHEQKPPQDLHPQPHPQEQQDPRGQLDQKRLPSLLILPTSPSPPQNKEPKAVPTPKPIPPPILIIPSSKPRSQNPNEPPSRPARIQWTQLTLRSIALLASVSALAVAIYVTSTSTSAPKRMVWVVVFVSSIPTTLLSTTEILSLLSVHLPPSLFRIKIPRLHPIALILADLVVVGLSIWSFIVLFLDGWGRDGVVDDGSEVMVEGAVVMWITISIVFIHALLFAFDCIDGCSARSPNSRVHELKSLRYSRKKKGMSRVGDDVFEMDWG